MFKYLKKYWLGTILAPLFMIGEVSMDLMQPRLMSSIIDDGVLGVNNGGTGSLELILYIGIKMILFVAIGGICGVLSGVFANLSAQQFGNDIRKDVFKRIMSLSFEQTDKFSTGSLITRVTNDITQLQNFVMQSMRGFVRTSMLFIGGIVCMVGLNMEFGLVIACALPFIAVCVVYFIAKSNPKFTILQKKLDRLNNVMQENVSGSRVVKAYVREGYEIDRFNKANEELVGTQLDVLLLLSYMTPIMNIILNIAVVAVIKVGGIQAAAGRVTPGEVMAAVTYCSQVLNAVMRMTMIFQTASRGVASKKRIIEVLDCEPSIKDGQYTAKTQVMGKVEFKNVSFAYPGTNGARVIEDFNLVIYPGETIGILGATGCGKTSLINLIPRFYDVTEGKVLVDNIDVRDYSLSTLRDKVSVALQRPEIFNTTIKENILWGFSAADKEMINTASDIAQATEFIERRPDGIMTVVSQGGHSLSGGQKQRVAIARAVIKPAEILIFDDATSALDLKTEADLYAQLNEKKKKLTRIIIAQRIASVKNADRIVVMDNGRLVDVGSHEQLMKTSKIYKDIYDSQLKSDERI